MLRLRGRPRPRRGLLGRAGRAAVAGWRVLLDALPVSLGCALPTVTQLEKLRAAKGRRNSSGMHAEGRCVGRGRLRKWLALGRVTG